MTDDPQPVGALDYSALFARRTLGIRPGLALVQGVYDALGRPCADIAAVHIVGTNGKGSVAAMSAHLLAAAGRRVGLYTSPHLHRVTERVRIAGHEVQDAVLAAAVGKVTAHECTDQPRPLSFFEVLTLAALVCFADAGVDTLVIEAGLGGRLDATRLVHAKVHVVTSIALDHQRWLGDTLAAIAAEKAGVMCAGIPVLTCAQTPEVMQVLRDRALELACALSVCAPQARAPRGLPGAHQRHNASLALAAARRLGVSASLEELDNVRCAGRSECLRWHGGEMLFDVAHNPASVAALVATLMARETSARPTSPPLVLAACSPDKDATTMGRALASVGELWSLQDPELELVVLPNAARTFSTAAAPELLLALQARLERGGQVIVCGSHRLVASIRAHVVKTSRADASDPRHGS